MKTSGEKPTLNQWHLNYTPLRWECWDGLKARPRQHQEWKHLERTNDNVPQKETTEMVWPRVKKGRGGHHHEDAKYAGAGEQKKGRTKRWLDNLRDDMKECNMTEDMAQNQSVWHVKTKACPLLHRGGLKMRNISTWRRPIDEKH